MYFPFLYRLGWLFSVCFRETQMYEYTYKVCSFSGLYHIEFLMSTLLIFLVVSQGRVNPQCLFPWEVSSTGKNRPTDIGQLFASSWCGFIVVESTLFHRNGWLNSLKNRALLKWCVSERCLSQCCMKKGRCVLAVECVSCDMRGCQRVSFPFGCGGKLARDIGHGGA